MWDWHHAKYDTDEPGYQLTRAYKEAQQGDVSRLKGLALEDDEQR